MQLSSRIFAKVWRKIRDSFAKVNGTPRQFPDMGGQRVPGCLLCVLLSYCKVATLEAAAVYFVYYFHNAKLRLSRRGCGCLLRTFVLKSCDCRAGAEVYFVYYFCDERCENSPAKVPRWGSKRLVLCSRRCRFPEQGISNSRNVKLDVSGQI